MKTLLIALGSSYTHVNLAIYSLKSEITAAKDVSALEFNINQPKTQVLARLFSENADCYMFSCYLWNIDYILSLASDLKKMTGSIIVLGGSEVSYTPEKYTKLSYIDYVVCGEAEHTINVLLRALEQGEEPARFDNIFNSEKAYAGILPSGFDFSQKRFPYTDDELRTNADKILYYESTRGCPHHCAYCLSERDNRMRAIPLNETLLHIDRFIKCGVREVKFVDRTFNANARRAEAIVRHIISRGGTTCFHFEICAETLSETLIELFENAPLGMFQLEAGLQSINPAALSAIGRKNDLPAFQRNVRRLASGGNVHVHADLIALLPCERVETFLPAIDFLWECRVHMLQLGILKILKGTSLAEAADGFGIVYSDNPPYNALMTSDISPAEAIMLGRFADLLDKYYNSMSFPNALCALAAHYSAPSAMLGALREFFECEELFSRSLGKRELYTQLLSFSQKSDIDIALPLVLDYGKYFSININLPALKERLIPLDKADCFNLLASGFTAKYLPEYAGQKPKEIYKRVALYRFDEKVLLFDSIRDRDVYGGNRAAVLSESDIQAFL